MSRPVIRCAIYTRKSSDEGLDQEFNSLDAQHEACAAYVASQKAEAWTLLSARYDDGGVSGGTLERPALRRLLADIEARRIDMVVVYKIDRLTRSLADFARLVERLEAAGCSFVSVTQAFNTSSSMGRLTLNMLLSFAQFEREVTAERIRDKIAASKKKGLWMGGVPPLGYDPHPDRTRRELVAAPAEATTVQRLFALYLDHGCLNATARAATAEGLRSKRHRFASGREAGGTPFSRGQIHKILTNPVYRGLIRHRDRTWPGRHPAIIDAETWDRVQATLRAASARRRGTGIQGRGAMVSTNLTAPLLGKVRDETGNLLTPTHARRHGKRYRYYVSNRLISGGPDPTGWRLPAATLERSVAQALHDHLDRQARRHALVAAGSATELAEIGDRVRDRLGTLRAAGIASVLALVTSVRLGAQDLAIDLAPEALGEALGLPVDRLAPGLLSLRAPIALRRRGVETRIIAGDCAPAPDPTLLRALRNAHRWAGLIRARVPIREIARREQVGESYVARVTRLALLSPKIQQVIVEGRQPVDLSLARLLRLRLPLDWRAQETRLGITSHGV